MPVASADLRTTCAAIQRAFPGAFSQLIEDGGHAADVLVHSAHDLALVLPNHAQVPAIIHCGDLRLRTAGTPEDLVSAQPARGVGPLTGRVAVVSGAASGLGLGVARGLHAAGACVLFTDVDVAGLAAIAAALADPVRVATAVVDVTREDSVSAGFDAALARFGRVDIIASCAGVAPAYDLVDFPLDKFRLANEINLTGYFLYGREAARIMKAQGHGGSMVLLSSKSGLEPSKANTAYNATKAGELHMARGWALELGRDGIRVNCIAPGNVFEGSKIWNPDYIAKAAQKKGIRPDEVIPYYVGLTAMNREIKPQDIANAAVFLASDQARCITGQVIVVDAGQVWAR